MDHLEGVICIQADLMILASVARNILREISILFFFASSDAGTPSCVSKTCVSKFPMLARVSAI
jgi:hypothetical protein